MPCGCKNRKAGQTTTPKAWHDPGLEGVYAIQGAETTERYEGEHETEAVFIVGLGSEYEQLFTVDQRNEARQHAKDADPKRRLYTIRAAAGQIPRDVAERLFAD